MEVKDDPRKVFISASSYNRAAERARELGLNPHAGARAWIYYDSIDRARGFRDALLLIDDKRPMVADVLYLEREHGWEIRNLGEHQEHEGDPWAGRSPGVRHYAAVLRPNPRLPEHLRAISARFHDLAVYLLEVCQDGPELVDALGCLRRAKDSAVMQRVLDEQT